VGTLAVVSFSFAAGPGSSLPLLGAAGSLRSAGMRTWGEPRAGGYTTKPTHIPTAAAAASRRYIGREREAASADSWLTERADNDDDRGAARLGSRAAADAAALSAVPLSRVGL